MTPTTILPKQPRRELRPVMRLATQPANAPKMIHENRPRFELITSMCDTSIALQYSYQGAITRATARVARTIHTLHYSFRCIVRATLAVALVLPADASEDAGVIWQQAEIAPIERP